MNLDRLKQEIARLREISRRETDTGVQRAIQHRIANLERELAKRRDQPPAE